MLVKLTEVVNNGAVTTGVKYTLREVMINPEHVIMIREDHRMSVLNEQGAIADGLSEAHTFSKLTINRRTIFKYFCLFFITFSDKFSN